MHIWGSPRRVIVLRQEMTAFADEFFAGLRMRIGGWVVDRWAVLDGWAVVDGWAMVYGWAVVDGGGCVGGGGWVVDGGRVVDGCVVVVGGGRWSMTVDVGPAHVSIFSEERNGQIRGRIPGWVVDAQGWMASGYCGEREVL